MNNRGWGLQAMLILTFILLGALIVSYAILVSKMNFLVSEDNSGEFIYQYRSYEDQLEEAARDYVFEKYPNRTEDTISVSYTTLKEQKYVAKMMDPNKNLECNGYVEVIDTEYTGYIDCFGSYKTIGYDSNK